MHEFFNLIEKWLQQKHIHEFENNKHWKRFQAHRRFDSFIVASLVKVVKQKLVISDMITLALTTKRSWKFSMQLFYVSSSFKKWKHSLYKSNRNYRENVVMQTTSDRIFDVKRIWSSILMRTSQNICDRIKQTKWFTEHRAQF